MLNRLPSWPYGFDSRRPLQFFSHSDGLCQLFARHAECEQGAEYEVDGNGGIPGFDLGNAALIPN